MRIFIGIALPTDIKRKILSWQEKYQSTCETSGVRFIEPQNLHITLVPPWHVDDTKEIVQRLEHHKFGLSFNIHFEKILFMPPERSKYVWVFGPTPDELTHVRLKIVEALGKPLEKRSYALHTTIARMQKNATFTPHDKTIHWSMSVKSFSLFRSFLSPNGAEYEEMKRFSLK